MFKVFWVWTTGSCSKPLAPADIPSSPWNAYPFLMHIHSLPSLFRIVRKTVLMSLPIMVTVVILLGDQYLLFFQSIFSHILSKSENQRLTRLYWNHKLSSLSRNFIILTRRGKDGKVPPPSFFLLPCCIISAETNHTEKGKHNHNLPAMTRY